MDTSDDLGGNRGALATCDHRAVGPLETALDDAIERELARMASRRPLLPPADDEGLARGGLSLVPRGPEPAASGREGPAAAGAVALGGLVILLAALLPVTQSPTTQSLIPEPSTRVAVEGAVPPPGPTRSLDVPSDVAAELSSSRALAVGELMSRDPSGSTSDERMVVGEHASERELRSRATRGGSLDPRPASGVTARRAASPSGPAAPASSRVARAEPPPSARPAGAAASIPAAATPPEPTPAAIAAPVAAKSARRRRATRSVDDEFGIGGDEPLPEGARLAAELPVPGPSRPRSALGDASIASKSGAGEPATRLFLKRSPF